MEIPSIQQLQQHDTSNLILIIQHSPLCPPGYIIEFLQQKSISYYIYHIYKQYNDNVIENDNNNVTYPISLEWSWRAIITLGGPQASYEDHIYPYLKWEKTFLKHHYEILQTPLLGICLGSQLLADVIGGHTYKGTIFEIGYPPMLMTKDGRQDEIMQHVLATAESKAGADVATTTPSTAVDKIANDTIALHEPFLNHHGDTFRLPECAIILLKSSLYTQAYKCNNVYGVQFHPEAGESEMQNWINGDSDERLAAVGQTREAVMNEMKARKAEALKASETFFNAWWKTIENHQEEGSMTS